MTHSSLTDEAIAAIEAVKARMTGKKERVAPVALSKQALQEGATTVY